MNIPFKIGNILLPKNTDMTKWSVIACDQYTSEPEYWNDVEKKLVMPINIKVNTSRNLFRR